MAKTKQTIFWLGVCILLYAAGAARGEKADALPHIILVLADDMGMGDLGCYTPDSTIPTPHIDRLAEQGLRFTDAHSSGAVCTPTRYGLMTGRYYWRMGREQAGTNAWAANLIEPERLTVADVLKQQGYRTACVGKWHLGLGTVEPVDYASPFHPNPTDHGFDSFYGIAASLDMEPYCYIENDRAVVPPEGEIEGTPYGSAQFFRGGPIAPGFKHEEVLPDLTDRAVRIIDEHGKGESDFPLFLYFPLTAPHTPWVPVKEAEGKSGVGLYGDFVWQVDQTLGRIVEALDRNGMTKETLLIFSSDNGGLHSWIPTEYDHRTNLHFRGQKGDAWEGGHRVPMIVRWPGKVPEGRTTAALFCHTDMLATFASLTGAKIPEGAAEDSSDQLNAILGKDPKGRDHFIAQAVSRDHLALRKGDWKYIPALGGGGLGFRPKDHEPEPGGPVGQLYHLGRDPGEAENLYASEPEKVKEMEELLEQLKVKGSSSR